MNTEQIVARELLKIGAVKFVLDNPITFKSGIVSPIYIDNRELPFNTTSWKIIIEGFQELIKDKNIKFDVVAGVAVGGIPHSSAFGFALNKPSIFVRKESKSHGTKSLVEGGDIKNKKVLLIEDLVSTGGSSLNAIKEIKNVGGIVEDCLVIVSYGFRESIENFKNINVKLYALTSFPVILEEALNMDALDVEQAKELQEWFSDPHGWHKK